MIRTGIGALAALVVLGGLAVSPGDAAIAQWNLKKYVEYYEDIWVGEIIARSEYKPAASIAPCTELTIKGRSIVTGKKGVQKVCYPGTDSYKVSISPRPEDTRRGTQVMVFLEDHQLSKPRGALWTPCFATVLRMEKPRFAKDWVVVKRGGSFLKKNAKLSKLEGEIRSLWTAAGKDKMNRKGGR